MKKSLAFVTALILLGAGCAPASPSPAPAPTPLPAETAPTEPEVSLGMPAPNPDGTFPTDPVEEMVVDQSIDAQALNVSIDVGNFFFKPSVINAKPGQTVSVTFTGNEGFHTFVIKAVDLKVSVQKGESVTFVAPSEPGSYEFICDVGSHAAMGMKGTLVVE